MPKIIVGFDGSEQAERALDRAVGLAGEKGVLVVVSAARLSMLSRGGPVPGASAVDPIEAAWARGNLDNARARIQVNGFELRTVEGHGDPADVLVRQAKEDEADLIVVGTRGQNATQRAMLGSVSTKVLHHAPCDVLVVR
jgi:nucleotide-binding universal stress UspA family protein